MKRLKDEEITYLFTLASSAKRNGASLSGVFREFAKEKKLAKGTVRNIYYEYLKRFEKDESLKAKYLGENVLKAEKVVGFDELEARWLLKKILVGATFGKPVRRIVLELTDDAKKSLRYQNKYRNMLRSDRPLVEEVSAEIKAEYGKCCNPYENRREDSTLKRLKAEINDLYERIAKSARDENVKLKARLNSLEEENGRLKHALLKRDSVKEYFDGEGKFVGEKSVANENEFVGADNPAGFKFVGGKIHKDG